MILPDFPLNGAEDRNRGKRQKNRTEEKGRKTEQKKSRKTEQKRQKDRTKEKAGRTEQETTMMKETIRSVRRPDGTVIRYAEYVREDSISASDRPEGLKDGTAAERICPVFVLIHGNAEDHTSFSGQINALGDHFGKDVRIIAPDCRGRGLSDQGPAPLTLRILEEDVIAVMDAEKIGKCCLLGFSDGGNMALELVLRYPDRFETLISVGSNLYPSGVAAKYQIPTVLDYYRTKILSSVYKGRPEGLRYDRENQLLRLMVKEPSISPGSLKNIRIPTLVIAGENDMIKGRHTRLIADSIPGAVLEIIPGGSHFVMMEMPETFNEAVIGFLKKIEDKQAKRKYPSVQRAKIAETETEKKNEGKEE